MQMREADQAGTHDRVKLRCKAAVLAPFTTTGQLQQQKKGVG